MTILRRRLAARILDDLPYGGRRHIAERLEMHEVYVGRALRRPDEYINDFSRIADYIGWEPATTPGFFREKERVSE